MIKLISLAYGQVLRQLETPGSWSTRLLLSSGPPSQLVDASLRNWFYARAGVSPVSAAETGLMPATWHRRAQAT